MGIGNYYGKTGFPTFIGMNGCRKPFVAVHAKNQSEKGSDPVGLGQNNRMNIASSPKGQTPFSIGFKLTDRFDEFENVFCLRRQSLRNFGDEGYLVNILF
jgi:hypothetical protein